MRSFQTPLGFTPEEVAVAGYVVGLAGYDQARGRLFQERVLERIAHLPGVDSAAYSSSVPLSIDQSTSTVYPETTTAFRPKNSHAAKFYDVSPGYFGTAGTPLLAGREFTLHCHGNWARVAIVNHAVY